MINRALIRLKTVQVIYAYYQSGGQKPEMATRELAQSLDSAYSLYKTLLYLPIAVSILARKRVLKLKAMGEARIPRKEILLSDNRLAVQLENNTELSQFIQDNPIDWLMQSDALNDAYTAVLESDPMEEYSQNEKFDFETDRDLWKKLYKTVFWENDALDLLLEEQNIYWNGDRELIDSFVMKTFKSMAAAQGESQPLISEFKDEEDRQFAIDLLQAGLNAKALREETVNRNCQRWDPSRLAFMDVLIIQVALGELTGFPGIPVKVTINEYVELAKMLSTPQSGSFVNGMLDTIAKEMVATGKIQKQL